MPKRDKKIKKMIEEVIGDSRKGRMKVIALVQKKHPKIGSSRIRRVYEQEGFALHKKIKRRIKMETANPISIPLKPLMEWGIDFTSDALTSGQKIRTLNIIDHHNRACMGIAIAYSLPSLSVIKALEKAIEKHGKPSRIRTDNGPEFVSKNFQKWMCKNNIEWSRIQPGKPTQNAIIERFNRTYREDVLDATLFKNKKHAQQITDTWIEDYNTVRPHQSLQYKTPHEYKAA